MARTGGPRRSPRTPWLAAGALAVLALAVAAACSSGAADKVKGAALERLAVGTWRCTAEPAAEQTPFTATIREGGFTVDPEDPEHPDAKLTGRWSVVGGDLQIEFTGAAAGAPELVIEQFEDLTLDSRSFALDDGGLLQPSMAESEAGASDGPVEIEVETEGTDSITLTVPGGDPWTCDRQ